MAVYSCAYSNTVVHTAVLMAVYTAVLYHCTVPIHLFLWPLRRFPMGLQAFTELAKHKECGICVWSSEHLPGSL
jgi:hypothetical protein